MVGGRHQELPVRLYRDTPSTPWGFRLQGGQDCNAPLTVQRVFVGSASDGQLHRGDIIVAIDNSDVTRVPHHVAEELIKRASRELLLTIRRGEAASNEFHPSNGSQGTMSWPGGYGGQSQTEDDYQSKSVGEIRNVFAQQAPKSPASTGRIQMHAEPGSVSYVPKRPVIVRRPNQPYEAIAEPGWTPKMKSQPVQSRSNVGAHSPPVNRPQQGQQQYYRAPSEPIHREPPERPAWLGTLRSSGGPRLWEIQEAENLLGTGGGRSQARQHEPPAQAPVVASTYDAQAAQAAAAAVHNPRVQAVRYSPGGTPMYDQYSAQGKDSDTARVAHLQYNTPLGLYSKDNAREVLDGQTQGKAGYGTMQISGTGGPGAGRNNFDPAASDVYRLVLEEDEIKKHGGHGSGPGRPCPNPAASRAMAKSVPHYQQMPGQFQQRPQQQQQQQQQYQQQQQQPDEHHSAKFNQLVHENDDQLQQYAATNDHYQYQQPQHQQSSMRNVEARFDDMGISDF